jgi:glutamate-5-semialdehyde dehydrogenase
VTTTANELQTKGEPRDAARELARASTDVKNRALHSIADALLERAAASSRRTRSMSPGRGGGLAPAHRPAEVEPDKLEAIARDTGRRRPARPIGEMTDARTLPNGLQIGRRRVPLGVIAAISESRPNVTVDIAALLPQGRQRDYLRGGKETINSTNARRRHP